MIRHTMDTQLPMSEKVVRVMVSASGGSGAFFGKGATS